MQLKANAMTKGRPAHYLTINGSPHPRSRTERYCKLFEDHLDGPTFSRIDLFDLKLPHSDGTYREDGSRTVQRLRQWVLDCDGMFISSPTYWFNVPAPLKSFMEQLAPIDRKLWRRERLLGLAVHAPEGGELGVFQAVVPALNIMGFSLVGNGYVYYRRTRKPEDWVESDIRNMAHKFSKPGHRFTGARPRAAGL
jgi:multimeric flavodoxin WrbA